MMKNMICTIVFVVAAGVPVFSVDLVLQEQYRIDSYSFVANISCSEFGTFISVGADTFLYRDNRMVNLPLDLEDSSVVLDADLSGDKLCYLSGYPGGQSEVFVYSLSQEDEYLVLERGGRFTGQRVFYHGNPETIFMNAWDAESEKSVLVRIDYETEVTDILLQSYNLVVYCIGENANTYVLEQGERFTNPAIWFSDGIRKYEVDRFDLVTNAVFLDDNTFLLITESGLWLVENGKPGLIYHHLTSDLKEVLDFEYSETEHQLYILTRDIPHQVSIFSIYSFEY